MKIQIGQSFPSRFRLGQAVLLKLGKDDYLEAWIRTATFTKAKVFYPVYVAIDGAITTLENVDSLLVEENPQGAPMHVEVAYT